MSNRITIDKEFDIEFDGTRCYTLIYKKVITGEGRGSHLLKNKDSIGKTREVEIGYYGSLKIALVAYADKCVGNKAESLTDVMRLIKECEENIEKVASVTKSMAKIASVA